ncbi:geranylgeranylglycerol-phosphate geranylgeranyltransferase [Candidatus Thermokryptus mobilis]|uniref:Geranylgeranylglycerol-phosphate geranylgeranyltransferase n=1 Tax=Candidatus Thermokryptus mobilis TaxID=1643428 RepID=A0A0S4ND80_9BACT|nr:geranylgeranylglycerol-phosphate geranylgeranyltransferase [Candidatus Thermokryptus mobilis]CUU09076.1 geranylgeranylglycerol-phosphate geranylgeranyltransferase [Candidatus Thermokryptus mobilis]
MNFKKLTAIIKITRPSNVFITFLTIFASVLIFSNGDEKLLKFSIIGGIVGALIDAGGNIINDFFDVEIDKINKPKRPIPSGLISRKLALYLYILTTSLGIILSNFLGLLPFLISLSSSVLIFLYSFRLKRLPLFGNFIVAFLTGLAFIFAGSIAKNIKEAIIPMVFALLINLAREIIKDIEDIEGDMKAGLNTFPIKAGIKKSIMLSSFILAILILLTPLPYMLGFYNKHFILIVSAVDLGLIYVVISLFKDQTKINLNRLSNILKFEMILGLLAIYFGSL